MDTISPDFIAHMAITCTTLSMRGVASLVEPRILTSHAIMKMFGRNLTGIVREWCRVLNLVTTSLVFTDLLVTTCIVSKSSNAVNCRQEEVCKIE